MQLSFILLVSFVLGGNCKETPQDFPSSIKTVGKMRARF